MILRSILDLSGEDGVELFFGDQSVLIDIGSNDQLVKLLIGDVLTELLSNSFEVLG